MSETLEELLEEKRAACELVIECLKCEQRSHNTGYNRLRTEVYTTPYWHWTLCLVYQGRIMEVEHDQSSDGIPPAYDIFVQLFDEIESYSFGGNWGKWLADQGALDKYDRESGMTAEKYYDEWEKQAALITLIQYWLGEDMETLYYAERK